MIKQNESQETPAAAAGNPRFGAVTLDCETAVIAGGEVEPVLLCVTDYVTGALLLKRYICTREPVANMRKGIHGVSRLTLEDAISQLQALSSWEAARSELWKYIDANTIIVGHRLNNDLDALRIIHPRIVDSKILVRDAVGIHHIRWELQTICSELVGLVLKKQKGYMEVCLENCLATREVVLFCTRNKEAFTSWAKYRKGYELRHEEERAISYQKRRARLIREADQTMNHKVKAGGRKQQSYSS